MLRTLVTLTLLCVALFATPTLDQMQKERRIALVIANADYAAAPLSEAIASATAMRTFLEGCGFEVLYGENVTKKDMIALLREFTTKIRNGGSALFYYYGHAIQNNGENYLIPYEASVFDDPGVRYQAIKLDGILRNLDKMPNRTYIAVLETAFGNPFKGSYTPDKPGLAPLKMHKKGSLFLSAHPGKSISRSALTKRFITFMKSKGLSLKEAKPYLENTEGRDAKPLIRIDETNPFYFVLPDTLSRAKPAAAIHQRSFG